MVSGPLKILSSRLEKELYCLRCGHLIDRKEDVYIIELQNEYHLERSLALCLLPLQNRTHGVSGRRASLV